MSHTKSALSAYFSHLSLCLFTVSIVGCASPAFTRYPVAWAGNPGAERAAFQQHDPFPAPHIGPDTSARPREFAIPRSEARQAAEQRLFQGLPSGPEFQRPGPARSSARRSSAVY